MSFFNKVATKAADRMINKAVRSTGRAIGRKIERKAYEKVVASQKKWEEEARRKESRCYFNEGLSFEEFERIALNVCKYTKRVSNAQVRGTIVYATMKSNSGISRYHFNIDFNDYGHITGKYWIRQANQESSLPTLVAERISEKIKEYLESPKNDNIGVKRDEKTDKYEYGHGEAYLANTCVEANQRKNVKRKKREEKEQLRKERHRKLRRARIICNIMIVLVIVLYILTVLNQ